MKGGDYVKLLMDLEGNSNQSINTLLGAIWKRYVPHNESDIALAGLEGRGSHHFGFMPDGANMPIFMYTESLLCFCKCCITSSCISTDLQ